MYCTVLYLMIYMYVYILFMPWWVEMSVRQYVCLILAYLQASVDVEY